MKRGLKEPPEIPANAALAIVAAIAPMKRGLKDNGVLLNNNPALGHLVAAIAPMKRGLKGR